MTKQREKILHHPTTHDLLRCLSQMSKYSKLLIDHAQEKPYTNFLKWLLEHDFFKEHEGKLSIKKLGLDFKADTAKITKWLSAIYEDIFELNYDRPELFQQAGIPVTLYMKHYDDSCMFNLSLVALPREYETFNFFFVKAKVGIDHFWVNKVEYDVGVESTSVTIWLKGGFVNRFRQFALDKALFLEHIHFMEVFDKTDFEIDDRLQMLNRNK